MYNVDAIHFYHSDQPDFGAFWRSEYEEENFEENADILYDQLKPLYDQLHAYVRRKLYNVYGEEYVNLKGPIPVPITGKKESLDHFIRNR